MKDVIGIRLHQDVLSVEQHPWLARTRVFEPKQAFVMNRREALAFSGGLG